MRIVAGRWRGRRIEAPPGSAVRPTLDRVREAWMSIVQRDLPGARIVDLFAGSGALGLEALSRGAEYADFVERDARSIRVLQHNITELGASESSAIRRTDAIKYATNLGRAEYDVAFADPPYETGLASELAHIWLKTPFATILSVEHSRNVPMPEGGDTRRYGTTAITFYRSGD
ncbi:MAG TPA: 16S rRNA (guanine(966)-N(2))-methyltransferase RsmD [Gemmatimonadaceae bacterium]|nr:16S rRNA (guanine(966)-N(2))-methyltransferase RsmD [Gemmatimonadaceae bacterium]